MTWDIYRARGQDGVNSSRFHGRVTAAEMRDDSYGTPYYHLTVEGDDGHEYKLLSDYSRYPVDFAVDTSYTFTVLTAAARGVLISEAVEDEG